MAYSNRESIEKLTSALIDGVEGDLLRNGVTPGHRPMLVLDMDGNIAIGHNLKPGVSLRLGKKDNALKQSIPSSQPVEKLLEEGKVEQAIFSLKPLDTRLPANLVEVINQAEEDKRPFDIVLLTSRSLEDALRVLELSGVKYPERMTVVADSGALLRVSGEQTLIRPLDAAEDTFLSGLENADFLAALETGIDGILERSGFPVEWRPRLFVERKGIATNIHFNRILDHLGQTEGSALDGALGGYVRAALEARISKESPCGADGKPAFKTLEGPATIELKIADVDKGQGLQAVVDAALTSGYRPSAVVFAGDDVCKRSADGHVSHGTDYAAFSAVSQLQEKTGIPFYALHTQHPESGLLDDVAPSPSDSKAAAHAGIIPDLILPTPKETAGFVSDIVLKSLEKEKEITRSVSRRLSSSAPEIALYR